MPSLSKLSAPFAYRRSVVFFGVVGVFILVLAWGLLPWSLWQKTELVVKDQRSVRHGINTDFGYSIERYQPRDRGFLITIWAGASLCIRLNLPHLELLDVKRKSWIAGGRAVLLDLRFVSHDSINTPGELAILYDFEKGEMHSFVQASAWLVWPADGRSRRQLSREEFNAIVVNIDRRGQPSMRRLDPVK